MKKITQLNKGGNIYVVLGDVGSGKTSLALSHKGKTVLFSFDASYSSLAGHEDHVTVYEPDLNDYANPDKFIEEVGKLTNGADLVVFDNLSALQNTVTEGLTDGKIGNNKNGMAAYGYVQKFLHRVSDWALKFDGDVLFTLWSAKKIGSDDKTLIEPDMNDKAFNMIGGFAKLVSRTQVGFDGYEVVMNPDGRGVIKNRLADKITKPTLPSDQYWKAVEYANK